MVTPISGVTVGAGSQADVPADLALKASTGSYTSEPSDGSGRDRSPTGGAAFEEGFAGGPSRWRAHRAALLAGQPRLQRQPVDEVDLGQVGSAGRIEGPVADSLVEPVSGAEQHSQARPSHLGWRKRW